MSPNLPSNDSAISRPNGRKPSKAGRVVPAIPYALSKPKPKPPRPQPHIEPEAKVELDLDTAKATAVAAEPLGAVADVVDQTALAQHDVETETRRDINQTASEPVTDNSRMYQPDTPVSRGSASMSISDATTPDPLPSHGSERAATSDLRLEMDNSAIAVNSVSTRTPAEPLEMQQLMTQLPPAFVPAAEQRTPQSAVSSSEPARQFYHHGHAYHPSTSSIVFGGHESSTSSPAPPHSANSAFSPPQYPNSGAPIAPYIASSASTHASEPQMQRMFPNGHAPSHSSWNARQAFPQQQPYAAYHQPPAHAPFRYPPREVFTPTEAPQPDGHVARSRSASRTSSARGSKVPNDQASFVGRGNDVTKMFHEEKIAFQGPPYPRTTHPNHLAQPLPHHIPHPDLSVASENAMNLRGHIYTQFANPSLADCHLQIVEDSTGSRQYLECHRLILSRSPTLLDLIHASEPPGSAAVKTQVHVNLNGQYVRLPPFIESVRYLYGGPLLDIDQRRTFGQNGDAAPTNEHRMEHALQYIATGAWLKVHEIAFRGVEVATSLLHWDTVTAALAFALQGGLSHVWSVDDGSEDKISCASSDDSLGRSETATTPTHDPYATQLLHRIIQFTVYMFPQSFYLDASAPQLSSCPRLPASPPGHQSRPSRSDPRLSKIRFGEMAGEDHQRPSFVTTTISSLLLSLPFVLLKPLLENFDLGHRLGADTLASIMRQVILEREARRAKALASPPARPPSDGRDAALVQNLYWEELVEPSPQHRAGFRLARRRRGIDTPTSSTATSEQSQ